MKRENGIFHQNISGNLNPTISDKRESKSIFVPKTLCSALSVASDGGRRANIGIEPMQIYILLSSMYFLQNSTV